MEIVEKLKFFVVCGRISNVQSVLHNIHMHIFSELFCFFQNGHTHTLSLSLSFLFSAVCMFGFSLNLDIHLQAD